MQSFASLYERLAKDQVMASMKKVDDLKAEDLGFATDINVKYLNICDHLTPRLQALYNEVKKVREAYKYKFCWAKNGFVYIFASLKNPQFTNSPTLLSSTRHSARLQKLE